MFQLLITKDLSFEELTHGVATSCSSTVLSSFLRRLGIVGDFCGDFILGIFSMLESCVKLSDKCIKHCIVHIKISKL